MRFDEFATRLENDVEMHFNHRTDLEFIVTPVTRGTGMTFQGMTVHPRTGSGVYPNIDLDSMYQFALEHSYEAALDKVIGIFEDALNGSLVTDEIENFVKDLSFDKVKDNIIFLIINKNKLSSQPSRPHRIDMDFAIVYAIRVSAGDSTGMIHINDHVASMMGVTEEQLFDVAMNNTPLIHPFSILKFDMFPPVKIDATNNLEELSSGELCMVALTNDKQTFGAGVIYYPGLLDSIREEIGDFYIAPSSIHEVMIVPKELISGDDFLYTLRDINHSVVDEFEVLSDELLQYDGKLSLVLCSQGD